MGKSGRDFCVLDRIDPFLRKIAGKTGATVAPAQALPFLDWQDHQRVAAVTGDDDRLVPGLVAQSAEGLLKLAGRDADWIHKMDNIDKFRIFKFAQRAWPRWERCGEFRLDAYSLANLARALSFSVSLFNCPQAARMSRPRGVRTGLA